MITAETSQPAGTTGSGDEPSLRPEHLGRFLAVTGQLGLALLLLWRFGILADRGLPSLLPLLFGGFVVHAWLPARWRLAFFLALSLASFALVLGPGNAAILTALGLGLIGLAHLPLPHPLRWALVGAAGVGLAALRGGWLPVDWAPAVLPILGAMFMFRMIIYLYDLRHEPPGVTVLQRVSYFFLLPNCLLPLFPVVDYRTFLRTRYQGPPTQIYQRGVSWMVRGVLHLLLYRLIHQNYQPAPGDVTDLWSFLLFATTAWLLYLRISGLFHLAVGMLLLFGFALPETNHHYFLASGFTDLWRRGNIYWKDFMMKVFYYPVFMRLRRQGATKALVVSTLVVFLASWMLHSYQWFWIRGDFPLTRMDAIFWSMFGLAVLVNSLVELRFGRARPAPKGAPLPVGRALVHALKVLGMFSAMCCLWSFWTGDGFRDWLSQLAMVRHSGPLDFLLFGLGLAVLLAVGVVAQLLHHRGVDLRPQGFAGRSWATAATAGVLIAVGTPALHPNGPPDLLARLCSGDPSQGDTEAEARGYYEGTLATGSDLLAGGWEAGVGKPADWLELRETAAVRETGDLRIRELVPDFSFTFKDAPFRTNRWGFRDQDYARVKPAGTRRIALLGGSVELGAGVDNDQTYEAVLERRLNQEAAAGGGEACEILNFGVSGYSLLQMVAVVEDQALAFGPDLCLVTAHSLDLALLKSSVQTLVESGLDIPDPELRRIVEDSGLRAGLPSARAERIATRILDDLVEWAYGRIAALGAAQGARVAWVHVPLPRDDPRATPNGPEGRLKRIAKKSGFVILSLDHAQVYGDRDPDSLSLRPWDMHPNVEGHERLAEGLRRALIEHAGPLGLGLGGSAR